MAVEDVDFINKVQDLLDQGLTMNKAAKVLCVHHSKVNRLLRRGEVELYTAFDEVEGKKYLNQNLDWLWEEDKLEEICNTAFDEDYANVNLLLGKEDFVVVGSHVREKYGSMRKYLIIKNKSRLLNQIYFTCGNCGEAKSVNKFSSRKTHIFGIESNECISCIYERVKKFKRENERYAENCKKSVKRYLKTDAGKLSVKVSQLNRRAMKESLPNDLTMSQTDLLLETFSGCALTGSDIIHWDHVIPISIGRGGTTYGNMIPLRADLNISKNNANIFEWFEANRQRFELSQERFDKLIAWLASANAMTVEEYRDYVYWCHANRRNIDEVGDAV